MRYPWRARPNLGPHRRQLLWWSTLVVGATLVVVGLSIAGWAGHGLRSSSERVAGVPVEVVRPAGAGVGRPAVVVAHGYAGSGKLMRPFADTLARRGYLVALPDLAGHGGNAAPLAGPHELGRDIAAVVRYIRGLPDVDPGRVALLGHSMGAAAVVRAGAADPGIAATVAISLGDGDAATADPGPRRLLLIVGAFEPAGFKSVAQDAAGGAADRRVVQVPFVEHVGVLYADGTHREAADWIDRAVRNEPDGRVIVGKRRLAGGGLSLVGMLLLLTAVLTRPLVRGAAPAASQTLSPAARPSRWLVAAVAAAPVPGLVGGRLLASALPAPVTGYLIGYLAFTGAGLAAAAALARRLPPADTPGGSAGTPVWRDTAAAVGLTVAGGAAVVVPVHVGLTTMAPHGPKWWLATLLVLAVAVLLAAARAAADPPWSLAVVAAVCLPLPAAALVGFAPGFLVLITPLLAVLLVLYLVIATIDWRTGMPWWRAIPAGAVMLAWPVATALPVG
nr:alpha/beta fold hydrolase [Micromonospora sp. DSM 115978]